jgi:beta-glucosidase
LPGGAVDIKEMEEVFMTAITDASVNPENYPAFMSMIPLTYNLNEIEHQMYMFDHRCVGCVTLACTRPVDTAKPGHVFLDDKEIENFFFVEFELPTYGKRSMLAIPVRGLVDYDKKYNIKTENFKQLDGSEIPAENIELTTLPRSVEDNRYADHDTVAKQAAREGMVLLKNKDNILPLDKESVLNLFGEGVTNFRIGATGAGRINPRFTRSLREAVMETSSFKLNSELDEFYRRPLNRTPDSDLLVRSYKQSNTAVIILTRGTGENIDNAPLPGEYYLTTDEESMIAAVCEVLILAIQ